MRIKDRARERERQIDGRKEKEEEKEDSQKKEDFFLLSVGYDGTRHGALFSLRRGTALRGKWRCRRATAIA